MHTFTRPLALAAVAIATTATLGLAPATAAGPANPFAGDRRVILAPTGSEGALEIDRSGRAVYSERFGQRSMFVLTEVRDQRYWLRIAEITAGGEPLCLQLDRSGPVRAVGCDAAEPGQLFRVRATGRTSSSRPTYLLHTGRRHLVQQDDGSFAAVKVGEGTPDVETPFVLLDRGPATLPVLD